MTASRLGKKVGVSESTVVRFAFELGYDGYPDMQRSLQKMIRNRLTTVQRIEVTNDRLGDQDLLSMVLQSDIEKIRQTLEELDRESFNRAVDAIVSARKIYIIGVRSSAAIALALHPHVCRPMPARRNGNSDDTRLHSPESDALVRLNPFHPLRNSGMRHHVPCVCVITRSHFTQLAHSLAQSLLPDCSALYLHKKVRRVVKWYEIINFAALFLLSVTWPFTGQSGNSAFIPLLISDAMLSVRYIYITCVERKTPA